MKKFILSAVLTCYCLLITDYAFPQGTAINTTGAAADSSAILDVSSTSKGVLISRMTTTNRNAIVSPAEGLMIFNTTSKCTEVFADGMWQQTWCSCPAIATPAAGTHTPSANQVIWNWNSVAGASGYKWNTINFYFTATDNGVNTSYTQTGLSCNTSFTLYVWAYKSCGNYSPVLVLNQSTTGTIPSAPVAAAATNTGDTRFDANWASVSGATSYHIDVSTDNNFNTFVGAYNDFNVSNVLTYTITGLTKSTTYYYRVRALNNTCPGGNSSTITATTSNLASGIVSYWKLDESAGPTASDAVGSNSGTTSNVSFGSSYGKINNGAYFNGSNSSIIKNSGAGLPLGSAVRSAAVWVKINNGQTANQVFINYGNAASNNQRFSLMSVTGKFYFCTEGDDIIGNKYISDGLYHFCVVTYDGSVSRMYVDGVADNSGTPYVNTVGTNIYIGQRINNTTEVMNGSLDEIAIWSRVLSPAEILTLYNGGAGMQYPF